MSKSISSKSLLLSFSVSISKLSKFISSISFDKFLISNSSLLTTLLLLINIFSESSSLSLLSLLYLFSLSLVDSVDSFDLVDLVDSVDSVDLCKFSFLFKSLFAFFKALFKLSSFFLVFQIPLFLLYA